jgi:hypothetical protein
VRKHLTPSMIVSLIALLVALSGSAYAATKLTGADIKDSSLTAADVKNSSLTGTDVKDSSLTAADITDSSLTAADIKDSSLTGTDIEDGTVGSKDLDAALTKTLADLQTSRPVEPLGTVVASGLAPRTGTATIPAGQTGKADAVCESSLGVVSGGFRTTGDGRVTSSEYTAPNTWSVSYDNTGGASDAAVTAIAYCSLESVPPLPLP